MVATLFGLMVYGIFVTETSTIWFNLDKCCTLFCESNRFDKEQYASAFMAQQRNEKKLSIFIGYSKTQRFGCNSIFFRNFNQFVSRVD